MEIVRIVKEKQEEEKELIEIRMVEEMVSRRFHEYLKVFEKKLKKMLLRMPWNYAIDLREGESTEGLKGSVEEEIYSTIKVITDITSVFYTKEEWEKENCYDLSPWIKTKDNYCIE